MNGLPWWYGVGDAGPLADSAPVGLDQDGTPFPDIQAARVVGGVIYSACTMVEPGVVHSEHDATKLVLGQPDGGLAAATRDLAGWFQAGGLRCEVTPDIRAEVWGKLMTNLACGPICLLSRRGMRDSFADPVIRVASVCAVREGMAIAEAALGRPLAGTAEDCIARLAGTDHKPSILQDLEHGRPLEFETLFDQPLRLARVLGVETPMLDLLTALAAQTAEAAGVHRRRTKTS